MRTPAAQLLVAGTLADSPAAVLPVGSEIIGVSAGEVELTNIGPQTFSDFVAETAPAPLTVTYEYNDEVATEVVTPQQGLSEDDQERYIAGVSLALVETQNLRLEMRS